MKVRTWLVGVTAVCAIALLGWSSANAGGDKKKDKKKQDIPEYTKPGPEHKILKKTGKWTYEGKGYFVPGGKPIPMAGITSCKMLIGGRYLQEHHKGTVMGAKFEGMGITGYDRIQKKWVSTWMDNMGTGFMNMEGTYDQKSKTLTMKGSYFDPESGKTKHYKTVVQHTGPGREKMEMYEVSEGSQKKLMELLYEKTEGKKKKKK